MHKTLEFKLRVLSFYHHCKSRKSFQGEDFHPERSFSKVLFEPVYVWKKGQSAQEQYQHHELNDGQHMQPFKPLQAWNFLFLFFRKEPVWPVGETNIIPKGCCVVLCCAVLGLLCRPTVGILLSSFVTLGLDSFCLFSPSKNFVLF